jgi:hypothetical protein
LQNHNQGDRLFPIKKNSDRTFPIKKKRDRPFLSQPDKKRSPLPD